MQMYDDQSDLDAKILLEVQNVDWGSIDEGEAKKFGMAIGAFRDNNHRCQVKDSAWFSARNEFISFIMLSATCLALGAKMIFVLHAMLVYQLIRVIIFYRKRQGAYQKLVTIEKHAIEVTRQLAINHPLPVSSRVPVSTKEYPESERYVQAAISSTNLRSARMFLADSV